MSKTLCKLGKKSREKAAGAGMDGQFSHFCRKCLRMASKKKRLCKPRKA